MHFYVVYMKIEYDSSPLPAAGSLGCDSNWSPKLLEDLAQLHRLLVFFVVCWWGGVF